MQLRAVTISAVTASSITESERQHPPRETKAQESIQALWGADLFHYVQILPRDEPCLFKFSIQKKACANILPVGGVYFCVHV